VRNRRARICSIVDLFGVKPDCYGRLCSSRWWRTLSRIMQAKTLPGTESSVTPRSLLQSWRSPFPFQRGRTRLLFQSVEVMPVFQAEHRTACNYRNTAFPPALRSSAWMPRIPGASPHFNRFTAACVSTNEGGPQLIGGSTVRTVTPLTSNSTAGGSAWYSRSK